MNENIKAFLDAIQNNEELKEKVAEIDKKEQEEEPEERLDEYIAVAKEYGLTLTKEDLVPELPDTTGMSEEELQAVTGGEDEENALLCAGFVGKTTAGDSSRCFCFIGGGGKEGCGCAMVGLSGISFKKE